MPGLLTAGAGDGAPSCIRAARWHRDRYHALVEPKQHLEVLHRGTSALLDAAAGATHRSTPTCPGWDVADLVVHAGTSWQWVADVVATGRRVDRPQGPQERAEA
jgi:Mycothiol maleylpyruvate isomerase N-terminal domain